MITNIQFMRAIAAIMVVFYHSAPHYFIVDKLGEQTFNVFSLLHKFGYIGVDIFFVISGYIMYYTTYKIEIGSLKSSMIFLYKRLTRIYLPYWIFFIIILLGYSLVQKDMSHVDLISSFFLSSDAIDRLLLPVTWTLTYELYFYIVFSILLFFSKTVRINILKIAFLLILFIQVYNYFITPENEFNLLYKFFLSPLILEFITGSFIAYYFETKRINNIVILLMPLVLLFGIGLFYQEYILGKTLAGGYTYHERVLFFGSASALSIAIMVELHYREIKLFSSFSSLLGDSSYSLYLSHTIILLGLYFIGVRGWIREYGNYQMILMLIIIVAIGLYSIAHYKYIEKPLSNFSKKILIRLKNYIN